MIKSNRYPRKFERIVFARVSIIVAWKTVTKGTFSSSLTPFRRELKTQTSMQHFHFQPLLLPYRRAGSYAFLYSSSLFSAHPWAVDIHVIRDLAARLKGKKRKKKRGRNRVLPRFSTLITETLEENSRAFKINRYSESGFSFCVR